jgi:Ser-tRNA(Ala) deacylase AlaX
MAVTTYLLFRDDAYLQSSPASVIAVETGHVHLDRTISYPLGGGQPGDRGTLQTTDGRIFQVADTRKGEAPNSVIHLIHEDATALTAYRYSGDHRRRLVQSRTGSRNPLGDHHIVRESIRRPLNRSAVAETN